MNSARLLREITRMPMWRYEDNALTMTTPPGVYAMHRHVTNDECRVKWSTGIFFNQAIPPVIPSPTGVYTAPFLLVNLRHTMREYDPKIDVELPEPDATSAAEVSATGYDPVNGTYDNDVFFPSTKGVYNVFINGMNAHRDKQPARCMNKPMHVDNAVDHEITYESKQILQPPLKAEESRQLEFCNNIVAGGGLKGDGSGGRIVMRLKQDVAASSAFVDNEDVEMTPVTRESTSTSSGIGSGGSDISMGSHDLVADMYNLDRRRPSSIEEAIESPQVTGYEVLMMSNVAPENFGNVCTSGECMQREE